jgi:hypothetical protein
MENFYDVQNGTVNKMDDKLKDSTVYLTESDFYPPSDDRVLRSYIRDVCEDNNFREYAEYIYDLYEEENYYEN